MVGMVGKDGVLAFDCCRNSRIPYGFSVSRTPIVGLDFKDVFSLRNHGCGPVCASLSRNCDNGAVEKEFGFKPSFDEYVKAMEAIKTDRERRNSGGFGKRDEEFDRGGVHRDMDGDAVKRRENAVKGKAKDAGFKDDLDGEERNWGKKLISGRWSKYKGDIVESKSERSIRALRKDGQRDERPMKRMSKMEETDDRENNFVEDHQAVRGKSAYKLGRVEVFEDELDGDESSSSGFMVETAPSGALGNMRWSQYEKNSVESRSKSSRVILERRGADSRQEDKESVERTFEGEEMGGRGNDTSTGFHMNPIQIKKVTGKGYASTGGTLTRSCQAFFDKDGNESSSGFMVERVPKGALENRRWSQYENNGVESRLKSSRVILKPREADSRPEDEESVERTFERKDMGVRGNVTSSGFHINPIQVRKVSGKGYTSTRGTLTQSSKAFFDKDGGSKSFEESSDNMDKPRVSQMEMEERIQRLANCLNGADIHMPEWMFSKMVRSAKIIWSDHSVLRIIQLLGKLGNWRRMLQVIEWLQLRERVKSYKLRYIYTAALTALQKARRPVEALNVFRLMQQQKNSYPDIVAYHSIAETLGQAGHMKELFDVIDSMRAPKKSFRASKFDNRDPRLEPDTTVYNAVLNACVQQKQWEGAFWVLQQLKKQGLEPSSVTYGIVMEVMLVCGKYNLVHQFFTKIQRSSIPNALTYRVLVNTLWKEGKIDETVQVVQDMENRGIVGSAALYYDFARCLCSVGRCEKALMQIEKISKVATKPLVVIYTGLIQACLDSGNIQNSSYIFSQMHKFCSPNLVTCNIMLKAYNDHAMFEEAKKLFQEMLGNGNHTSSKLDYRTRVIPDIYSFNTMLDACFTEKKWDDFKYIYERMLYHGFRFNSRRHLRMILDPSNPRKEELVEITWEHVARTGRVPPPALTKERFCMKLEKNDHAAAMACITNHGENESAAFSKQAWLYLLKENGERFSKENLVRFIRGLSTHSSGRNSPGLVFLNLLSSCKEYVNTVDIETNMNL